MILIWEPDQQNNEKTIGKPIQQISNNISESIQQICKKKIVGEPIQQILGESLTSQFSKFLLGSQFEIFSQC